MNEVKRLSTCEGKVGFRTLPLARKAARRKHNGRHAYFCAFCGYWHVGTALKRREPIRLKGRSMLE